MLSYDDTDMCGRAIEKNYDENGLKEMDVYAQCGPRICDAYIPHSNGATCFLFENLIF